MLAQIIVSIVGKGQDAGTITKVEQVADIIIDKAALTARSTWPCRSPRSGDCPPRTARHC